MLDNEPNAGAVSLGSDTTTTDRTAGGTRSGAGGGTTPVRRRSASRPAGPPPEPEDTPPATMTAPAAEPASAQPETAPAEAAQAEPQAAPAAEDAKPKRATRRKATAKAAEETAEDAGPVKPARRSRTRKAAEEPVPDTTGQPVAEAPAELAGETAAEEVPAPTRRRRTRKETTPERSSAMTAAEAEVAAAMSLALPDEEQLDEVPAEEAEGTEDIAAAEGSETAETAEDEDADVEAPDRSVVADPFGLHAQRMSEPPSLMFQAPAAVFQPLFQAPDPFSVPVVRPQPAAPAEEAEEQAESADTDESAEHGEDDGEAGGRRRRRRRGGRGRGVKTRDSEDGDEAEIEAAEEPEGEERGETGEDEADGDQAGSRRRRRRRRRGTEEAELTVDDPPNTVVRIRAPRATRATSVDEVQGVRGSTRLEAKKQRRREGRELGRRRPPIITESEFLARRESVERVMVVRRHGGRTQIAVLEDGILVEHYVDREASQSYVGNVYLGKVQNVLPSMEAAFVDIGKGRNAVLYAGEVNFDTAGLEGQPKRIEAALKSGQSVLVQVTKDPIGHKGARLTSQISLPGRYLVYVPDGSMTGISRKLPDKERTRLKQILRKVMPENAGVIVRTAAEGASEEELSRDVARLSAQWENIQGKAKSASPPELLSAEPDLTVRVVRDVFNEDFASLVVEGEDAWETVDEYVQYVAPHLADRLSKWEESGDVFASYRVDEQIAKAMERKVWLPSGGSLVIDRTEAMTVVDVNTGKFTGQGGNLEETVTRNNLEAAEEIVRQLRLRDVGGIIVIDFIDMVLESNRDLVLRRLLECLARDRTKHQVAEVTSLGLVQMTRKRVGQGLLEAFSTPCDCCHGRGVIISSEPVEAKPEPRGTQGKMAIEKAVAEKLSTSEGTAVAASVNGRDSVTDALHAGDDALAGQPRGRRRSRRKTAE
ncbi:Rne/Rng family ribonuclease [Microtetraspora glauca]|uniref:Rne/Rng family ribonuclease n=1 Tax=Microtetraspora glauca TaxID=1996 RepID=A0ABV3G7R0_MICGL